MTTALLPSGDVAARLLALNTHADDPWLLRNDALYKAFLFVDFIAAFTFMTRVASVAERLNHHPDWRNAWNRVEVHLSTHDAGGITALDFDLAQEMEKLAR